MERAEIEQLFDACDPDGRGYLTMTEFQRIGDEMNLSYPEVEKIFNSMDVNMNGRIEQSEFVNSFHAFTTLSLQESPPESDACPQIIIEQPEVDENATEFLTNGYNENNNNNTGDESEKNRLKTEPPPERRRSSTPRVRNGLRSKSWHSMQKNRRRSADVAEVECERVYTANGSWDHFAESMGDVVYALASYDVISQLYRQVEATGNIDLLRKYETMVDGMVKEIGRIQGEKTELEHSFERANEKSQEQFKMLEDEMESQLQQKEMKVREEERKRADEEGDMLKNQYEGQIEQLQSAIAKLKQMDEKLSSSPPYERELESMREKVKKLTQENSELKTKLTEAETNLILMQSTMAEMEVDHQEKTLEFVRDEENMNEVLDERDRFSKEVESLYTNNRKLLDSNDSLREALESSVSKYKRASAKNLRSNSGTPVDPMQQSFSSDFLRSGRSSRASIMEYDALAECDPGRRTPEQNGYLPREFDSGVGTIRDDMDDSETDWADESFRRSYRPGSIRNKGRRGVQRNSSNVSRSSWVSDGSRRYRAGHRGHRSPRAAKDYQTLSDDDELDGNDVTNASDITDEELQNISQSSTLSSGSRSKRIRRSKRTTPTSFRKIITPDVTLGHNKRMYKVVLCGDVGVGKTSFIYRLCRDEFVRSTKSTLGVDFQIKTIQLEHDRSVSLQLWDTAGQERFRSISASYFRRAEGVLLLYDCTSQLTFINVRDWMETITPVIPEGCPVMICGHKVDLREEREMAGQPVVSSQEGAQLAANYGVLFIETSALDGSNVHNSVMMLARHIKLDVESTDDDSNSVKRLEDTNDKTTSQTCCKQQ